MAYLKYCVRSMGNLMKVDDRIRKRLDELVKLGQKILDTGHPGSYSPPEQPRDWRIRGIPSSNRQSSYTASSIDTQLATKWLTSSLNLLANVFGESSTHYQKFNEYFKVSIGWSNVNQALGVLHAAKDDCENGALFDIKVQYMEEQMASVFLSHNVKDKPWVRKLAERLTSDGVVVWLDEAELKIGDSLIEKISDGIQEMEYVAAVISKNSVESYWVQKEISLAMSKEILGRKVTVLPLLIERCKLPAALIDKLYADFTKPENFETEYSKLLHALGVNSAPKVVNTHQTNSGETKEICDKTESNQTLDIRIVGVVKDRTQQDLQFPGLQDYFFQLSARPPVGWSDFFDQAREFPRHTRWRKAWIEGDCVVVNCALDELAKYHLRDLKKDVATANKNYMQAKADADRQKQIERAQREKAMRERDNVLEQLDFD